MQLGLTAKAVANCLEIIVSNTDKLSVLVPVALSEVPSTIIVFMEFPATPASKLNYFQMYLAFGRTID